MEQSINPSLITAETLGRLPVTAKTPWLLHGESSPSTTASLDYPKLIPVSAARKEELLRGDVIFEHDGITVIHPENPFIKEKEEGGMHLRIVAKDVPVHPKTQEEWRKWHETWAIAFGVAKVSTQGGATEALWQNFINRTNFSPDDYLVIEFFGRSPKGPSWGKTLPLPEDASFDHRAERLSTEQMSGYRKILETYFHRWWIPGLKEIDVFKKHPVIINPNSPSFIGISDRRNPSEPYFWKNEILFKTDKLAVRGVVASHVSSGIHLMTVFDPTVAPARPWEDVATALEGLAVTEVAAQLLEETQFEGKPLAARTRDTLTGSWFGRFSEVQGADYRAGSEKKRLAIKFRGPLPGSPDRAGDKNRWATNAYFHVYGTRYPDEAMVHFARGIDNGDPDWLSLQPVGMKWMKAVREVLNSELTSRIALAVGRIVK